MSAHWSPTLWRSAGFPACFSAATAARPAIVLTPVLLAVPASIRSPPGIYSSGGILGSPGGGHARRARGCVADLRGFPTCGGPNRTGRARANGARLPCLRQLRLALDFLDRAQEERLVDPTLKDRHPELHALRDDFAAVHSGLATELGGRQVDRHGVVLLVRERRLRRSRSFTACDGRCIVLHANSGRFQTGFGTDTNLCLTAKR